MFLRALCFVVDISELLDAAIELWIFLALLLIVMLDTGRKLFIENELNVQSLAPYLEQCLRS